MNKSQKSSQAMNDLYNCVPGGIFKCVNDERLTLLEMSDGFLSMIGYREEEVRRDFGSSLIPFIEPSDFARATKDAERQLENGNTKKIEYRLRHKDGHLIHVMDQGTLHVDEKGRSVLYCMVLDMDIDREMRYSQTLQQKTEQDALTNMYNKIVTQSLIREYLRKPEVCGTLILIDIDNFKQVNDRLGHLFGDTVLSDLSRSLIKSFRDSDVLGRIGGDEFVAFLKGVSSVNEAKQNAKRILRIFSEFQMKEERCADISCSIGIAIYPKDGRDFATLYQCADYALYHAKKEGKNRYEFYDESMMHIYLSNQQAHSSVLSTQINSNMENKIMNAELGEYVFRVLYASQDIAQGITSILGIVGNYFDVSRAYIFENSSDDQYCSNTFEWCNKEIASAKDDLQNLSYNDLMKGYRNNFDEKNIFYCSDVKQLPTKQYEMKKMQQVESFLQCAFFDHEEIRGFIGFDVCNEKRCWTQDQIDILVFISNIISTFLLKERATKRFQKENEGLHLILDNQNAWICVIASDTRQLLYMNQKISSIAPEARLGMRCHEAFYRDATVCDNCPADHLSDLCQNCRLKVYHSELDAWVDLDASEINWEGTPAILLCGRVTTKH